MLHALNSRSTCAKNRLNASGAKGWLSTCCSKVSRFCARPAAVAKLLRLRLADLLVQAGDQGGIVPGLLLLTIAEDAGSALRKSLLPGLNLPGMDFLPGPARRPFLALQRLKSHLGLLPAPSDRQQLPSV